MPADDANVSAVSAEHRVRKAVVDRPEGVRPAPSGLAAAYAPGVVVVTNGVLEPDLRHNFDPRPGMADHEGWERYREEMRETAKHGEKGKATFHVVDTDGNSVAGADISARFFGDSGARGQTDADGLFTVEGRTLNGASLSYTVNKQGFYQTRATYQLGKRGYRCLENGRWIPWNPTLRVTLKEIRKPIPMYLKRVSLPMPVRDQPVGFDFEAGEWVAPYGRGSSPDMQLTYTWTTGEDSWRRHDFTVEFTNSQDGAYMAQKDEYCPFMSEYEAWQDTGYAKRFQYAYERTSDRIIQDSKLGEHDIIVFRVRTEADPQGKIVNARYGKIYGPFEFAQGREKLVRFTYYFNPTPNDRNLEFDGEHNLSDPKWRGPDEPR
ncbi:MAG: carboxypeptidase-like regulatory domain-containing protein [Kiritimatiellia bacterium]